VRRAAHDRDRDRHREGAEAARRHPAPRRAGARAIPYHRRRPGDAVPPGADPAAPRRGALGDPRGRSARADGERHLPEGRRALPTLPDELANVLGARRAGRARGPDRRFAADASDGPPAGAARDDGVAERLQRLVAALTKEAEVLELGSKIQSEVQSEMSKTQREYYLREQIRRSRRSWATPTTARRRSIHSGGRSRRPV